MCYLKSMSQSKFVLYITIDSDGPVTEVLTLGREEAFNRFWSGFSQNAS
jgi:hypothetical protein